MVKFITESFIPVKSHVKEQPQNFERFKARWTPTQIILDGNGIEQHRIEGFLPVDDFLAELELGLGKLAFEHGNFGEAERHFQVVEREHHAAAVAPEARYWAGVSEYKASNRPEPLRETARSLSEKYPESVWTKKASVWMK